MLAYITDSNKPDNLQNVHKHEMPEQQKQISFPMYHFDYVTIMKFGKMTENPI